MAYLPLISPFGDRERSSSLQFEEFVPPSAWTEDSACHYLLVDLPGFERQELKLQVDNQTHIVVSGERQERENKYKRFEQRFELPNNAYIEKITGKLDGEILYISVPKKVQHQHQVIKHETHGGKLGMSDPAPSPSPTPASDIDEDDGDDDDEDDDEDKDDNDNDNDNEKKSEADENENEDESDNKDGEKDLERNIQKQEFNEDWVKEADIFLRLAIQKLRKNKGIVVTAIFAFSLGVLVSQKFQSARN